jgi:hypothetical protein
VVVERSSSPPFEKSFPPHATRATAKAQHNHPFMRAKILTQTIPSASLRLRFDTL